MFINGKSNVWILPHRKCFSEPPRMNIYYTYCRLSIKQKGWCNKLRACFVVAVNLLLITIIILKEKKLPNKQFITFFTFKT